MTSPERQLEKDLIEKIRGLKYEHRPDIRDHAGLEQNSLVKFRALNQDRLIDGGFRRHLEIIVTTDLFAAAHTLRNRNASTCDDGLPLNSPLVDINDGCKNGFEFISRLRINTDYSPID